MKLNLFALCAIAIGTASIAADGAAAVSARVVTARQVNETARSLAEFRTRVDAYVEVRKKAAADGPPLAESTDPAAIRAAQEALASRIGRLRAGARQGDIFTRDVRPVFRRLLATELSGPGGRDTRAALLEDSPRSVRLTINARYPAGAPLPTVPANILKVLPTLPDELEYRFVQRHLLLFDPEAEIIVDYIANAIR